MAYCLLVVLTTLYHLQQPIVRVITQIKFTILYFLLVLLRTVTVTGSSLLHKRHVVHSLFHQHCHGGGGGGDGCHSSR